jgi:DNA-binding NtrC family response regulator
MNISVAEKLQSCNHKRILIVDDEAAILFAYRKLIEREGLLVDVCESFEAAMTHIENHSYCAVIADMRLAGSDNTDGMRILQAVKKIQPDAKVIMVTGHGNANTEKMAYDLGAAHYFEKPVQPSMILDVLRSLMGSLLLASSVA